MQLFKQGEGHIRTEFYREGPGSNHYLTIDHWESKEACKAFREAFTLEENYLGDYFIVE